VFQGQLPNNIYLWEKSGGEFKGTTYKETREKVIIMLYILKNPDFFEILSLLRIFLLNKAVQFAVVW